MELILEQQASFNVRMEQLAETVHQIGGKLEELAEHQLNAEERHDRETTDLRAELRRAIRMSIEEHRRERVRRRELDQGLTRAQEVTEQKLQRLIDSLNQPRNGQ